MCGGGDQLYESEIWTKIYIMKKIILSLWICSIGIGLFSQSQMKHWSLAGRRMEFNTGGPVVLSPLPGNPATCGYYYNYNNNYNYCHNMITDNNGNIVFFIVDGIVYAGNGDEIGPLSDGSYTYHGVEEYAIAPDPTSDCKYYIFFAGEIAGDGGYVNSSPYYAQLDLNGTGGSCSNVGELKVFPSGGTAEPFPNSSGAFDMHAASVQFAVSKIINVSNERFVFVKTNLGFSRYRLGTNGLIWENDCGFGDSENGSAITRGETELVSLAGGGYRFATTYHRVPNGNPSNPLDPNNAFNKIYIANLDAAGNVVAGTIKRIAVDDNTVLNNHLRTPSGLEFSPDGNYLYFSNITYASPYSFTNNPINYYNLATATVTSLTVTNGFLFSNSQIELGYDQKLHLVNSSRMAGFSNPNTPTLGVWNPNESIFNFVYPQSTLNIFVGTMKSVYILPDQIDGENYNQLAYHAVNYTAAAGNSVWTNYSNPFGNAAGNSSNPIRVSGALTIPSGANVLIQNMTFEFATNAAIIVQPGAILKIDHTTLRGTPCGKMWSGIYVADGGQVYVGQYTGTYGIQSKIYDALQAISAIGNNAVVEVRDGSIFDANLKHIRLTNMVGTNVRIKNSIFRHFTALKDQDPLLGIQFPGSGYYVGRNSIDIINSGIVGANNPIVIGNNMIGATDVNSFIYGEYGITSLNSNVQVIRNNFSLIFTKAIYADAQGNSRAIDIKSGNTFTSSASPNNPMDIGIHILGKYNFTVSQNTFKTFQPGSLCIYVNGNNDRNMSITYNSFTTNSNPDIHIKAENNGGSNSILNINYNNITGYNNAGAVNSVGIQVKETTLSATPTFSSFTVQNNSTAVVRMGVELLNIRGQGHTPNINSPGYNVASILKANNISYVYATTFEKNGIKTSNCPGMNLVENSIVTDSPWDWASNGIYVFNSPSTLIYGNVITGGTGILAWGNMNLSNYYCNTFINYTTGIKLVDHILRNVGTHGTTAFGRPNLFLDEFYSNSAEIELVSCNNSYNQWACLEHPNSNVPFNVTYNGATGPRSWIEFSNGCTNPCKDLGDPDTDRSIVSTDEHVNTFSIYPNPNNGDFMVSIENANVINSTLYIVDLSGRILHTQSISLQEGLTQLEISKPELPAGIYFVKVDGFDEPIKMIISK